jgi:hypothetical protein
MPAYWFMYNLYALARNSSKYADRDKRTKKIQGIEYDYLAPDSINEIFSAIRLLEKFTGMSRSGSPVENPSEANLIAAGKAVLDDDTIELKSITVSATGFECSTRPVCLIKVREAYRIYKQLIVYYGISQLLQLSERKGFHSFSELKTILPEDVRVVSWSNIGGQLLPASMLKALLDGIKSGKYSGWDEVHEFYQQTGRDYEQLKLEHAFASLLQVTGLKAGELDRARFNELLDSALQTREWMVKNMFESREKDYTNKFRRMVYDSEAEMEKVIGNLDDNQFILQQQEELVKFREAARRMITL